MYHKYRKQVLFIHSLIFILSPLYIQLFILREETCKQSIVVYNITIYLCHIIFFYDYPTEATRHLNPSGGVSATAESRRSKRVG